MRILYFLIVFCFIFSAFFAKEPPAHITNPILSYYFIQARFLRGQLLLLILVVPALVLIMGGGKKKRFLISLIKYTISGSAVAFLILFLVSLIELNVLSALTHVNPKLLDLETDTEKIIDRLKVSVHPPAMADIGGKSNKVIPVIASTYAGQDSFYGSRIIPYTPQFLVTPAKDTDSPVMMVNDTLIINRLNSPEFQKVSPVVSYLMIKKYFPNRLIRSYPEVALMEKEDYLKFRLDDFNKKVKTFDGLAVRTGENILNLQADILETEGQIENNRTRVTSMSLKKDRDYRTCVNAGYYKDGTYRTTNSREKCQEAADRLDASIKEIKAATAKLETELAQNRIKLEQYKRYKDLFSAQKILMREQSTYVPYEFGTFNPPYTIQLVQLTGKKQTVAGYFSVLVHEYLHYANFNESGNKINSSFFDEALTEYFARRILEDSAGKITNVGYPVSTKILDQMMKRISETDLADIYFTNDQPSLEELLNRVYGDNFYRENIVFLETVQYASDPDQILQLANQIMDRIGGTHLTKEDLKTIL